jgi:phosphoserine phosphatase RsbU/P
LMMSTARAFLRALHERGDSTVATMTSLNRLLEQDMSEDRFMTMVMARLHDDGRVHYVAAGHEPPFIWRHKNKSAEVNSEINKSSGLPLGMLDDSTYDEGIIAPLAAGDLMILFTDGIPDVHSPTHPEIWGMDNMFAVIAEHAAQGADAVCKAVIAATNDVLRGHPAHDDMTLVVIERLT